MATPHRFKSSFGQCECRWCGRRRTFAPPECAVDQEIRLALKAFRDANGRTWKRKLNDMRMSGDPSLPGELVRYMNIVGPSGLNTLKTSMLDDVH